MLNYASSYFPWYNFRGEILTVTIDGITSIGNYAFSYCTSLKNITIPNSVTSIGFRAFYYCTSLQSITILNSVTSIGESAFFSCTSLKSISNGIHYFGKSSFYCTSLENVVIGNGKEGDESIFIDKSAFYNCIYLKTVTIKPRYKFYTNNTTKSCSIQSKAFFNCPNITNFIIEGYVDEVKEYAFTFNEIKNVNFEYHSNYSPHNCSSLNPNNKTTFLPIFNENATLIYVPINYHSNFFCPCDKYGCPISYIENKEYNKIKEASVPIEIFSGEQTNESSSTGSSRSNFDESDENESSEESASGGNEQNTEYCKYEQGSEINFYASSSSRVSPAVKTVNCLFDYSINSKVVINVKDVPQQLFLGNPTNPFIANELEIKTEQITTNTPYVNFVNFQNDIPLNFSSNHKMNKIHFVFNMGNSPTRIYGNISSLTIEIKDNGNYNLPRQRTFFGTSNSDLTVLSSESGLIYGISSFGDKFPLSNAKVSCGGMFRYYNYTKIGLLSISTNCNKTFTENGDDDFDSFVVTAKFSVLLNYENIYLSSSNIIVGSINDNYYQNINTYPNMFYKYNSTNNTIINIYGTNERKDKIKINLKILAKSEPLSTSIKEFQTNNKTVSTFMNSAPKQINSFVSGTTSIMEVQNENKTVSTYIIATSKQISNFAFNTFIGTETVKSQVMLIGLETQEISTTNGICKTVIKTLLSEQCYSCSEGLYLVNQGSNEKIKCSKTLQSKCVSCNKGYYVNNGTCQQVTYINTNCINSASNSYCSLCKDGYYLNEGICQLKEVNCMKYGNGVCIKCQFGYQLINNKCEKGDDSHCYYEGD